MQCGPHTNLLKVGGRFCFRKGHDAAIAALVGTKGTFWISMASLADALSAEVLPSEAGGMATATATATGAGANIQWGVGEDAGSPEMDPDGTGTANFHTDGKTGKKVYYSPTDNKKINAAKARGDRASLICSSFGRDLLPSSAT